MQSSTKSLKDLPFHTHFRFKASAYRVDIAGKSKTGARERDHFEPFYLPNDTEVEVPRLLNTRGLIEGDEFSFDLWDAVEAGYPMFQGATFRVDESSHALLRISNAHQNRAIPVADFMDRTVRVYTKAHPALTLRDAKAGMIFTPAIEGLRDGVVPIFIVTEVRSTKGVADSVEVEDDRGVRQRCVPNLDQPIRVWSAPQNVAFYDDYQAEDRRSGDVHQSSDRIDKAIARRNELNASGKQRGQIPIALVAELLNTPATNPPLDGVPLSSLSEGQYFAQEQGHVFRKESDLPVGTTTKVRHQTGTALYCKTDLLVSPLPVLCLEHLVLGEKFTLSGPSQNRLGYLISRNEDLRYLSYELVYHGVEDGHAKVSIALPDGPLVFNLPLVSSLQVFTKAHPNPIPKLTLLEEVPDLKYFEYKGVVYRKDRTVEAEHFGDVLMTRPVVMTTSLLGAMSTFEFGTEVRVIEKLELKNLVSGEEFTLDPSVRKNSRFDGIGRLGSEDLLLGELKSSRLTSDLMVAMGNANSGHVVRMEIPIVEGVRAYTKGYPRDASNPTPKTEEVGAAAEVASTVVLFTPEGGLIPAGKDAYSGTFIAPSCRRCKQPFGPYRKQVNAVCGDCVAAGTSLADQPPPAAAPEKKSRHWEAWSTPSYDGEG